MSHCVNGLRECAFASAPAWHSTRPRVRGRKRQGIRYEAAVQAMLSERFGPAYRPSPWIRFRDSSGTHWCQPDGLLTLPHGLVIVEVKYQHTVDAWKQLRLLYEPVVSWLHPGQSVSVLEVVKWYDCAIVLPEPVQLIRSVEEHTGGGFGVHIWKPGGWL